MKPLRLYLDTSVINFLFADDAPQERKWTEEFFEKIVWPGKAVVYISQVVADEIGLTTDALRRKQLEEVIRRPALQVLPSEPAGEVEELAEAYLQAGVLPSSAEDDALHVAICTVNEVDVLVSWNFKHLANVHRERRIIVLNESLGYVYPLRITTPLEVMNNE
jgi:predicted nucleic acid-binding protein